MSRDASFEAGIFGRVSNANSVCDLDPTSNAGSVYDLDADALDTSFTTRASLWKVVGVEELME